MNFMLMQGKNAGNPVGLPSILTWQKRKLTIENRGSDNFCHTTYYNSHLLKSQSKNIKNTRQNFLSGI